ncbi:cell division protein FtsZ [Halomonas sp. G15]|uniref:cell division protein FtsZ n=1 Tax=Halomonas sp. G15 TaxID=2903521 RepID=UPI001E2E8F87|nr:cell division protein FtsZ [Halomonas sp. G15]MCE0731824.1 cell division protein FtsZ [Halomonas sp. G15]
MNDDVTPPEEYPASLKVMGVGGGGGNAIRYLLDSHLPGVDFIVANTDRQALGALPQEVALPIGKQTTRGLGAGSDPAIGARAAEESSEVLRARLAGGDMLFLMVGMGGGTGSGAAPVIAALAREMGLLTVAVVTRPFTFEGARRRQAAEESIAALAEVVDSLVVVPNDRLLPTLGPNASMMRAFAEVNEILRQAVSGIAEVITRPGLINVDFADVAAVMRHPGRARIGTGYGQGEDRAREAVVAAIEHPLLEATDLAEAAGVLVSITAGPDLTLEEFNEIGALVAEFASEEAMVMAGTAIDMAMSGELNLTLVATGLTVAREAPREPAVDAPAQAAPHHGARQSTRPALASQGPATGELLDITRFLDDLKR